MPASQEKFEPEDPWGRPFIMPENVGLYCVLFPMGLLLIPVFTATGNYTGGTAGAPGSLQEGRKTLQGRSLSLSSPPLTLFPPFFFLT